jgi:hypothetical protein
MAAPGKPGLGHATRPLTKANNPGDALRYLASRSRVPPVGNLW